MPPTGVVSAPRPLGYYGTALLAALAFCMLSGFIVWKDWEQAHAAAGTSVLNTAKILANEVENSFAQVDALLTSVGQRYLGADRLGAEASERFEAEVRQEVHLYPLVDRVGVITPDGMTRFDTAASYDPAHPLDLSDRDYFTRSKGGETGLLFGGPLQSKLTGEWSLILSRRLAGPAGDFRGLVFGVVPVAALGRYFATVDLGPTGIINLRTRDLAQVVRYPALSGANTGIGNRNVSRTFRDMIREFPHQDHYVYKTVAPIDGVERVYACQAFAGSAFYMTVGRSTADFTRSWWITTDWLALLSLLMTLILLWVARRLLGAARQSYLQNLALEGRVSARTAELQKSNDQLAQTQFAMDRAGIGIAWNSVDTGRFLYCNDEICRQLGHTREELLTLTLGDINPPLAPRSLRRIAAELRADGGSTRIETLHHRRDGSTYPVAATLYLNQTADEEWFIAFFEDISAPKAAEAELRVAKDAAEAADRAKSTFLANMSHEIRTPMNAIIGMAHLALKTELTSQQRGYLQKIQGSGQHLLGILGDILDFSKIEAGKLTIEQVDFALEAVLDHVAGMVAERAADKGIELVVALDPETPVRLVGDPLRIEQVLVNFANNAVKFTEHGEIAIRVDVLGQRDDSVTLRFTVRDTGIGMSADQLQGLFQRFQQADTSITRRFGGTGLGLAIAKRLAALMGGEVGAASIPDEGSTFWFEVRLGRGREVGEPWMPGPDLRGRHVLVVDDNAEAREAIAEMLRGMTFAVTAVATGPAALAEIARAREAGETYDVVLLDWHMPDMDGVETARAIRRQARSEPLLLIMAAAHEREALGHSAAELGIADVLSKPLTPSVLFDALMRQLGGEPARRYPPTIEAAGTDPAISALVGRRILLVEDNALNQEVATGLLREVGVEVDLAPDGAVALAMVQQNAYDLVLMDMQMPVLDGVTATREIRRLPGLRDLPIVAMTANAMTSDRERCLAAGMDDHIAKPIDPRELWSKLLLWMTPSATTRPETTRHETTTAMRTPADQSAQIVWSWEGIAGLDVATGLRQVMGREALYSKVLATFVAVQADTPIRIAEAMAAVDWAGAERRAHTLKGVAAQIGASRLRDLSEQLEQAIRDHAPEARLHALQTEVADVLHPLIHAIAERLPNPASEARGRV